MLLFLVTNLCLFSWQEIQNHGIVMSHFTFKNCYQLLVDLACSRLALKYIFSLVIFQHHIANKKTGTIKTRGVKMEGLRHINLVYRVAELTVFENHRKKSHSTLRGKRATFTFWMDKSLLKMPKKVQFLSFWRHKDCGQTELPDKSFLIGQKW